VEHLHHFRLSQDPFQNEPDLRFYFESVTHRQTQIRVERGLRQNKGLTVLTGEGGTGKTLLARRILDALEEEIFEVGLMVMLPGAAGADSVLTRFARQLGVEEPATERAVLLAEIYEQLAIVREDGRYTVLILDDAQVLSKRAMAEVGGLLNLEYEDRRLMSLLVVGLPELDAAIAHDSSLSQRVDVRVRLESLNLQDASAYLMHRLGVVGGRPEIFGSDAVQALFKFGRGRPRLLNTLADNSLFEAYLASRQQVDAGDVEHAAADLGIGADPGTTYSGIAGLDARSGSASDDAEAPAAIESPGALPPQAAPEPAEPVAGEFTDPDVGPVLDLRDIATSSDTPPAAVDLGDLLESTAPSTEELTTLLDRAPEAEAGVRELDAAVELPAGEPSLDSLMQDVSLDGDDLLPIFEAEQTGPISEAEATCVVFQDEPPKKDANEEIDDLFGELIDD